MTNVIDKEHTSWNLVKYYQKKNERLHQEILTLIRRNAKYRVRIQTVQHYINDYLSKCDSPPPFIPFFKSILNEDDVIANLILLLSDLALYTIL